MAGPSERLASTRLYFIADDIGALAAALRGGVDVFQLRDKTSGDETLLAKAADARRLCDETGALFVVNDRPDIALAAGADGVHLGQDDMPLAEARAIVGPDRLVGRSTHTTAQIDEASAQGADYIGVGPVFATPTKAGRAAVGPALVAYAARCAPVPFFAIGGIDSGNARDVVSAGARRIAVVRAIARADDPEGVARRLRAATDERTRVGIT